MTLQPLQRYRESLLTAKTSIPAFKAESWYDVSMDNFDDSDFGGLQSDGLGGFLSALFTVTPLSIFAQVTNNAD